jgi:hypothetical protein
MTKRTVQELARFFLAVPKERDEAEARKAQTQAKINTFGGGGGRSDVRAPRGPITPDPDWLRGERIAQDVRAHPERYPENSPEELAAWVAKTKARLRGNA